MYKLLIIDDEKPIRDGIKKLLPWDNYGIEICGEASDGAQGFALLQVLHPQIVFTDIRMSGLDGIEFLKLVKQSQQNCKVVVLSGYDDFGLVRKAMKYGAVDYLLKPSGKEEIIKIIEEIIDNIEDEVISHMNNSEKLMLFKNNTLNQLICNEISPLEIRTKLELLNINIFEGPLCVTVIRVTEELQGVSSKEEIIIKTFAVQNVCLELIEEKGKGFVFTESAGKVILIMKGIDITRMDLGIQSILKECLDYLENVLQYQVTIAVGTIANTYRGLARSYHDAAVTLEYKFVFGRHCILFYDEIKKYFSQEAHYIPIDGYYLKEQILKHDFDSVRSYIYEVFRKFNQRDAIANQFVLKNGAMEILIVAFQCVESFMLFDQQRFYVLKESALEKIANADTLKQTLDIIEKFIQEIINEMNNRINMKYSKIVNDCVNCIINRYSEFDLSLQYLAEKYHVNAAYLGRQFKKETGSSFNDYLTIVRIEKAKDLLRTTNYKGVELCEKVGFCNYNYFYTVFKKMTGMKPMDVRKNKLGKGLGYK